MNDGSYVVSDVRRSAQMPRGPMLERSIDGYLAGDREYEGR
jgi:hypothetical protein